jgi:hypothetical protein
VRLEITFLAVNGFPEEAETINPFEGSTRTGVSDTRAGSGALKL